MKKSCTILIPTKDRPTLLRRSISSALLALPNDGEVLVVDDSSSVPAQVALQGIEDSRLRVVRNQCAAGASGARNYGISQAAGEVVFLLDDDDEILPHYCAHVLDTVLNDASAPDYGFASYIHVKDHPNGDGYHSARTKNNRLNDGPISNNIPFRHRVCGFGVGFWIRASVLRELGPIDESLMTNEDTEYSCRLIKHGKRGWFSSRPAMRVHNHSSSTAPDLAHVSNRTSASERAACFAEIIKRHTDLVRTNSQAETYLTRRLLRQLAKSGDIAAAKQVCKRRKTLALRLSGQAYLWQHKTIYRL